jgi:ABC-2 type transport system permease protein
VSDVTLVFSQARFGLVAFIRNPRALVFTIVFPVFFLVLFNSIFGSQTTEFQGSEVKVSNYFTPGILAYSIMMPTWSTLAISITTQREQGILKRLRGTPMPPWVFILGQIVQSLVVVSIMSIVVILIGWLAFGAGLHAETLPGLVIYIVLGVVAFCSLGLAVTSVIKSADAAATIAPMSAVILSFISGVFFPVQELPTWLVDIGLVFPLAHLADGLQSVYNPSTTGTALSASNVAILAGWGLAGVLVAARSFKWEPQAARG